MDAAELAGVGIACVWLACGLAATALTPDNRAARALLTAGACMVLSRLTEVAALSPGRTDSEFALLRTVSEAAFLGLLAATVDVLVRHPTGRTDRRWHGRLANGLMVLAVLAPVAQLAGSMSLDQGHDPSTARPNPFATDGLAPLGDAGQLVASTEPAWIVAGVVLLVWRHHAADPEQRRLLRWSLASVALLGALLVVVLVSAATPLPTPPDAVAVPVFLLALGAFPATLLAGITARTRALERSLATSRSRLVEAEDAARTRLERDLHDGVQQQLVAILSLTELASHQVRRDPDASARTLQDVSALARESITELRELVRGLRPPVLADAGLVAALSSRLGRLPGDVRLEPVGEVGRAAPAVEAAAYFVVNEAVTNALKHAPGSTVSVRVHDDGERLEVTVQDDGPGRAGAPADGGLTGLRDRVESLEGSFEVRDAPGGGTVVRAELPAGAA